MGPKQSSVRSGGSGRRAAGAEAMVDAAHRSEVVGKSLLLISSPAVVRLLDLLVLTERFTYASSAAGVTGVGA